MDPIRAGHVAIMGGRFLYYCDSSCKLVHSSLRGPASTLSPDEIVTADPPQVILVESGPRSVRPPIVTNGNGNGYAKNGTHPMLTPIPPRMAITNEADIGFPPAPVSELPRALPEVAPRARAISEPPQRESITPNTMRSPAPPTPTPAPVSARAHTQSPRDSEVLHPARPRSSRESFLQGVYLLGVAAGMLVPALGLLGSLANPVRLPLAVVATVALVLRFAVVRRDPAGASPLVVLIPVLGATVAAVWARATSDPYALRLAIFAGVAAAASLAVELLVARAKMHVAEARIRIARVLDVPVRVLRGEDAVPVRADEVKPGEQVLIEAGEVVGVDAVVTAGEATVVPWLDAPVDMTKREGDALVAGSRVLSGRLRALTTWSGLDRAWTKLALSRELRIDVASPAARATRLAVERGTPVVAALVGVAAFANNAPPVGIFAAACAAAVACGANGVAAIVGLYYARAHLAALASGIVYKDARAFDRAGGTDVAMFCARGTVLMGEPEIVTIEAVRRSDSVSPESSPVASSDVSQVLALAAGAEQVASHPFASAILRAARTRSVRPDNVRNAMVQAGLGVTALSSSGERLVVGSRALMLKERISVALAEARINELEAQGRSVLVVALADKLVGLLALQDGLRAGARAAVQRVLDAKVEPVLLSGEARETCETIGRALDIDHIRPEILPSDRGAEVRALGESGHVVGVIGHPETDDGALGAADVAVAMCAAGATPGEWAIALASDDVRDGAAALTIPHRTRERVRIVLAIGVAPGALALLAVAFGLAPLAAAPLAGLLGAAAALVHANKER